MPSERSPSPQVANTWWLKISEPNRARSCSSAIAIPTMFAIPCPSGPVVASTPAVWPTSGCPGVADSHWRKSRRSSIVRPNPAM